MKELEKRPKKIVSFSPIFSDGLLTESRLLEANQGELYEVFLYAGTETATLTLYDSSDLVSQTQVNSMIVRLRCSTTQLFQKVNLNPAAVFSSLAAILEGDGASYIVRRKILREGRGEREREERPEFYGEPEEER